MAFGGRWQALRLVATLSPVARLLVITQLLFNIGFFLVVPYLAGHLGGEFGLTGWLVGLVLGLRTFSQQGLFVVGGALTDRFDAKPVIVAGCLVRVAGFAVLAVRERCSRPRSRHQREARRSRHREVQDQVEQRRPEQDRDGRAVIVHLS